MECKISWQGAGTMAFTAQTGSGHQLKMDGPPDAGGKNSAPRPMELILAGTGGCCNVPSGRRWMRNSWALTPSQKNWVSLDAAGRIIDSGSRSAGTAAATGS